MAAVFDPVTLAQKNARIQTPLNPTGRTESLIDPKGELSYARWSISVVYDGTPLEVSREAMTLLSNRHIPRPQRIIASASGLFFGMVAHAKLIMERVTIARGYELIDIDLRAEQIPPGRGPKYCKVRRFINSPRTLQSIEVAIGPLFKKSHKVQAALDFAMDKFQESANCRAEATAGRVPENPMRFNVLHPAPDENIYNCIAFCFETAKAGGINLYALHDGGHMIPRLDIADIKQLVNRAVEGNFPMDPEILEYLENFEDESDQKIKDMNRTISSMYILGLEGPLVLSEYRRIHRELGQEERMLDLRILSQARNRAAQKNMGAYMACGLVSLVTAVPTAILVSSAQTVERVYSTGFEIPLKLLELILEKKMDLSQACLHSGISSNVKIGSTEGLIGILTKGRVDRKEYSKQCVMAAVLQLQNSDWYPL